MYFRKNPRSANEYELVPQVDSSTEKPVRRICRCPTLIEEPNNVDPSQQTTTPQLPNESSIRVSKLEESLPRFGPIYSVDQPSVMATKEKSWQHVLKNSPEKEETKELYTSAIRKVEREAKEMYADHDKIPAVGSGFRWMMIKDGCFFLQLAMLILGSTPEQLIYPSNDPIFGKKHNKKDVKKWIEAMFFAGNQIPLVILHELMKQEYFQEVLVKGKGKVNLPPASSDLCRKVFYEMLVLPATRKTSISLREKITRVGNKNDLLQASDLLHGLQKMVVGSGPLSNEYEVDDEIDLEANEDEIGRIFPSADVDADADADADNIGNRIRNILKAAIGSAIDDRKRIFPCASELKRAGIRIRKLKNGGVRNICFKSYYLWAFLYLPAFPVDDNTEILFRNLKTYEISQQLGKHRREVASYLRVMSDIVQTPRDVKLLEKKGVILGSSDDAEKLPGILNRLSSEEIRLTQEFRVLRSQIRDYSSPLIHYKGIINLVVFLTFIQAFFALLAYFKPPKQ